MANGAGKKVWILPDCELPPEGEGVAKGHESVIIVNDSDVDAVIDVKLFFNNSSNASAKIEIECEEEKEFDEWSDEYYYYQEFIPVIVFNDGSRNSLEDFFNEYDFEETVEAFEVLVKEFEEMFYGYDFGL